MVIVITNVVEVVLDAVAVVVVMFLESGGCGEFRLGDGDNEYSGGTFRGYSSSGGCSGSSCCGDDLFSGGACLHDCVYDG